MFGDRLKILRIDKGLSQQDIGEIVGKSQQAVAVWEKGLYEPDNESLIRLADYFNVSTDYLLGLVEEKRLYAQITTEIDIDNPDLEKAYQEIGSAINQLLLNGTITDKQAVMLLETCKGMRAELAIHLALYCGLRRGEIAALKWSDVNEEYRVLVITKAVEYKNNRPHEKGTKSKSGNRIIPVPPELWDMLMEAKKGKRSLYVVTSARGKQLTESAVKRLIEPVQWRTEKAKGGFHFTLHMLRHTYATNLDKMKVPDRTRQYLMGHSEISTTDIYTHIQDEHLDQARLLLQNIYKISVSFSSQGVKMGSISKQKPL